MNSKKAEEITGVVRAFRVRKVHYLTNPDLSSTGRAKHLQGHQERRQATKAGFYSDLKREWAKVKSDYAALATERAQAEEKAAAGWDYGRLAYLAETVKAKLAEARSVADVGAAYTQAAKSGDPYTRRAWAENLPARWPVRIFERAANIRGLI